MPRNGNLAFKLDADAGNGHPSAATSRNVAQGPSWHLQRLLMALAAAAGFTAMSAGSAVASQSKTHFAAHSQSRHVASTQFVRLRSKHATRSRPRRSRIASRTHHDPVVHAGLMPLVNTTWDDAAVPPEVLGAILDASRASGIPPGLLMAIAWRESRFAPAARSRLSSAAGLLQFTSGTWIQAVRDYGGQHGHAGYAAAIHTSRTGEYTFQDRHTRGLILKLRNDPVLSASLAAEVLGRRRAAMQTAMERRATAVDLYLMHVLGPTGVEHFFDALKQRPSASMLKVAGYKVLRNAGLLARDGRPMTVANTHEALRIMMDEQDALSNAAITKIAIEQSP